MQNVLYLPCLVEKMTKLYRKCCGAIILRTKAMCLKRLHRLVSISVDSMFSDRYGITHKCRVLFLVVERNM